MELSVEAKKIRAMLEAHVVETDGKIYNNKWYLNYYPQEKSHDDIMHGVEIYKNKTNLKILEDIDFPVVREIIEYYWHIDMYTFLRGQGGFYNNEKGFYKLYAFKPNE